MLGELELVVMVIPVPSNTARTVDEPELEALNRTMYIEFRLSVFE